jgi:hypothetical protein
LPIPTAEPRDCRCVDQTSGYAQNSALWHALVTVAVSGMNVPNGGYFAAAALAVNFSAVWAR